MKAIVYTHSGNCDVLKIKDIAEPVPNDNQVLVKVKASALNMIDYTRFTDTKENGKMTLFAHITDIAQNAVGKPLGGEISGIAVKVGRNVPSVKIGDEVYGVTLGAFPGGGWAEYALCNKNTVYAKPSALSFEEASAIPISGITALGAIRKANIQKGQKVLVYGSSGGVGQYVVQLAKAQGGIVTGVCSTRNLEMAKSIGADYVIDYKKEDFTKSGTMYDVIIGVNGYNPLGTYKKLLKQGGVYVAVGGTRQGMMGGMFGGLYSLGKKQKYTSSVYASAVRQECLPYLKELAENGKLKPFIDNIYPAYDVKKAIHYIIQNHTQGKVVLTMNFQREG